MLNKLLLLILLSAFHFTATAQKEGQYLADSLEHALENKNISGTDRVDDLTQLSFEYRNLLPKKAIAFGEQAEKLAKEIHDEKKLGEIYLCQSFAYTFYNDVIKAYELALLSLKYNTEYKIDDLIIISKMTVLSTNPNASREYQIAQYRTMLNEVNNIKNKNWYIRTIGGIGNEFKELGVFDISDSLINLAYNESKKNNFKFLELHNLARIAGSYYNKEEYDTALYLMKNLIQRFDSIKEKRINSELLGQVSDCYLNRYNTDHNTKWLDSADYFAGRSLAICIEIEYNIQLLRASEMQYEINKTRGNLQKAMENLENYVTIYNNLYGQKSRRKLESIAISQRDEIANAQLKIKDAEVGRQKAYTYAGLAGIGLAALSLFFVYRNYKNQKKSNALITEEKNRSEELLLNILPAETAEELKQYGKTRAKAFTMVTVMFTDFKDYTTISEKVSAELLVDEIHFCFSAFDRIIQKYKIEKIKTIGDAYMCASGLPVTNYTHATDMVNAAIEMRDFMLNRKKEKEAKGEMPFDIRLGINTGPVVAGIVGIRKFAYDIWGDTVNLAARIEQNSEAGKINISGSTYDLVKTKFACTSRGKINAKNKGEVGMYFVEGLL